MRDGAWNGRLSAGEKRRLFHLRPQRAVSPSRARRKSIFYSTCQRAGAPHQKLRPKNDFGGRSKRGAADEEKVRAEGPLHARNQRLYLRKRFAGEGRFQISSLKCDGRHLAKRFRKHAIRDAGGLCRRKRPLMENRDALCAALYHLADHRIEATSPAVCHLLHSRRYHLGTILEQI